MLNTWKPRRVGPPPYWLCKRQRSEMLVTGLLQKVVVFIGHAGIGGDFIADGTGFIFYINVYGFMFPYVVTAKHVVDQAAGAERKNDVLVRLNTKAGDVDYKKTKLDRWQLHPDHSEGRRQNYIDIAICNLVDYKAWERTDIGKFDFTFLDEEDLCSDDIIKKYSIGLGDEVVIPGLFHSHIGEVQNVPVIRTGNIAAMRGEPVPTSRGPMDAYLVEMRSIGGISGSPVLTNMAVRPDVLLPEGAATKIEKSPKTHFLLGLIHGHYTITTQDEWTFKTDQQVGDINAGIAVVIPASRIMETINASAHFAEEHEMAKQLNDARNAAAKTVEDSVPSRVSSPDVEENPQHLEDFKRLVDVAARKRPQGDQT